MIKVLLVLLVFSVPVIIGFTASSFFKKRNTFFLDFVDFLQYARGQISFFQTRKSNIFNQFKSNDSVFEKVLKSKENNEDMQKPFYIKEDEWEFVGNFLDNIGKVDVERECQNIDACIEKMKLKSDKERLMYEKNSGLSIKLGFAVGLTFAVIAI